MKKLTQTGEHLKYEFETTYKDRGCTCFISPPCNHCIHPGHPESLANSEDLWNDIDTCELGKDAWLAAYKVKSDKVLILGKGSTEQEAIDNLPSTDYLGVPK